MNNLYALNDSLASGKVRRLWLLSLLRLLLACVLTFSLAVTVSSASKEVNVASPASLAILYALTALAAIWALNFSKINWRGQLFAQLVVDLIMIGLLVSSLGGSGGGYAILYLMPIAAAATMMGWSAAMFVCSVSVLSLMFDGFRRTVVAQHEVDWGLLGVQGIVSFGLMAALRLAADRSEKTEVQARQTQTHTRLMEGLREQHIQEDTLGWLVLDENGVVQLLNAPARAVAWQAGVILEMGASLTHYPALNTWLSASRISGESTVAWPPQGAVAFPKQNEQLFIKPSSLPHLQGYTALTLELHSARSARNQHLQLAAMGRLSASIAHEIRNPLAAISQAAELMQETSELSAGDAALIKVMLTNSQRINRIVHNLLSWSHGLQAQPTRLSTQAHITQLLHEIASVLQLKSGQLQLQTATQALTDVQFDADHLYQIVSNLVGNATRFASGGAASIRVVLRPRGNYVALLVLDDGPPVDSVVKQHLFEPFQSASKQGTGLGLFLCREYALASQGSLELMTGDTNASNPSWVQAPYTKAFVLNMLVIEMDSK